MTHIGWRIYYSDGSVVSSKETEWKDAPAEGVQIVTEYYQETYQIWHGDSLDTENYCTLFHSKDYYWLHDGVVGGGMAKEVPSGLLDRETKIGMLIADDSFLRIYNEAKEQRVF